MSACVSKHSIELRNSEDPEYRSPLYNPQVFTASLHSETHEVATKMLSICIVILYGHCSASHLDAGGA